MGKATEVEIIARETIKPSSPTPYHLTNFKLSLLDQISPVEYAPILFFYTANDDSTHHHSKATLMSHRLKTSLSQTLTKFYPFAGIIRDYISIECNDNGVVYVEARAHFPLSDILDQPDQKLLREFLPIQIESREASKSPLLLVQATFFKCGGIAIGNCFSHMLADGSTISTFIRSWTSTALESTEVVQPEYVTSSVFPPDDSLVPYMEMTQTGYVTKRFVFHASNIAALRAKVSSESVPKPTGVEAVTALIWKCTTKASRSNRGGSSRLSLLLHAINLRKMVMPPLPENTVGNIVGYFCAQTREKDLELQDLVCHLRKGKEEFRKTGLQTILKNKSFDAVAGVGEKLVERDDIDFYTYSSLVRLPLYSADFGWGKPMWVTMPNYMFKNVVMLLGTKDGEGIEALVTLSEADMTLFQCDPALLAFASLNPSVLHTVNGKYRDQAVSQL